MDLIELRREFLESNHSKIIESLQVLRALRNLEPSQHHRAFDAIERLNSLGFETPEIIELWSQLADLLKQSDYSGRTLTGQERNLLLRGIEELRLRIVAVAVIVTRAAEDNDTEWKSINDFSPAIEHHSGDLVSAFFSSHIVILLPEIDSASSEQSAASGLLEIFERAPGQSTWIIDFSAMRQVTHLLIGIIYGYRENLTRKGGKLGICWLRDGIVPESLMISLRNKLDLIRIGDHWFSSSYNAHE